ncbi:MAG: hypothetical protein M3Q29_19200 [Chloroflexota bacterium]|nr:hypothetical protein [Chloroflexota bacterium]
MNNHLGEENERLRSENRLLREENERLREERDAAIQPTLMRQILAKQQELLDRMRTVEVHVGLYPVLDESDGRSTLVRELERLREQVSLSRDGG